MKTSKGHKLLLILAILVTLLVLAIYSYIYYYIGEASERLAFARFETNAGILMKEKERETIRIYESSIDRWSRLPDYFVKADNVVQFIEGLESLGPETGGMVTISSISADEPDPKKPTKEYFVRARVSSRGSWEKVMKVLVLAESMPYKVYINNVQLSLDSGSDLVQVKTVDKSGTIWLIGFDIQAPLLAVESAATLKK